MKAQNRSDEICAWRRWWIQGIASIIFSHEFSQQLKSGEIDKVLFPLLGPLADYSKHFHDAIWTLAFGWQPSHYLWSSGSILHGSAFLHQPIMGEMWLGIRITQLLTRTVACSTWTCCVARDATEENGCLQIRATCFAFAGACGKARFGWGNGWIWMAMMTERNKRAIFKPVRFRLRLGMLPSPSTLVRWHFAIFLPKITEGFRPQCLLLTGPCRILMSLCSKYSGDQRRAVIWKGILPLILWSE